MGNFQLKIKSAQHLILLVHSKQHYVSFPPQMTMGPYCYLLFCAICLGVALYTIFIIPETKNKTFMEISQMFASRNNIDKEELTPNGHLKMAVMNGYGTLGQFGER